MVKADEIKYVEPKPTLEPLFKKFQVGYDWVDETGMTGKPERTIKPRTQHAKRLWDEWELHISN